MRKAIIVLGGLVLLLSTTVGLSQIDSGGSYKGKGKGSKGSKGGGPPGSGYQPGGPSKSGGPSFGGRPGGSSRDPNQFFDFMAKGKEVLIRAEMDPRSQGMFDRIAASMGITSGQITRQQYLQYQANRPSSGGPPGFSSRSGPGSGSRDPSGGRGGDWSPEGIFRRLDLNGDGVLNYDEMPDELRAERATWDKDGNGFIDLAEFTEFYQARMAFQQQNRGPGSPWGDGLIPPEDQKPVVYRAGHLPANLPPWFQQYDTDSDAQIGLYEWKNSGRPLEEFYAMDRNGDGFVTVPEVMNFLGLTPQGTGRPGEGAPTQMVANRPFPGGPGGPGASLTGGPGPGSRGGPPRGPGSGPGSGRGGPPGSSGRGGPPGRGGPGSSGPGSRSFQPPGSGGR